MAVNDSKSKLIGLFQLKVNLKNFQPINKEKFSFDKCIDK